MEIERIQRYADLLYEAEAGRRAIAPLTETTPDITVEAAYAIQLENVSRAIAAGHGVSGKKIGLTSPGIQRQLGVDEPDYGHLFEAMNCPDGRVVTAELIQPKIEAELAFVLKSDLSGGGVTAEDVRRATDYVVGAFEIVDSRVEDWRIKLEDTVADNASSGRYVLGKTRLAPDAVDLGAVAMKLYQNGELIAEGTGAAVMGDPCEAVAWLSNCLFTYGVTLKRGEVILSGAFTAAPLARQGDRFRAEFSSFGAVEAQFV